MDLEKASHNIEIPVFLVQCSKMVQSAWPVETTEFRDAKAHQAPISAVLPQYPTTGSYLTQEALG